MTALTLIVDHCFGGLVLVGMLYAAPGVDRTLQLNVPRQRRGLCGPSITQRALHPEGHRKTGCSSPAGNIAAWDNASVTDTERDIVSVRINRARALGDRLDAAH
jgi:hypothetical protein